MSPMIKSSPRSEEGSETDSVLDGGTPLQPAFLESIAKTNSDADGKLAFVPSSTALRNDGNPQDLLLVGHGTIDGEERDVFALSWVSRAVGCARTHYYFLDSHGKHKTTSYDKVQKWLPGFWTAQITNSEFDEQRTRAQRILSLFHNKESLEEAMSTVFDPNNRVTDQEIMGATYVDDDDSGKDLREQLADEDDLDSLFDGSQAESEDDALSSLDEDDRANRNKLTAISPTDQEVRMRAVRPVLPGGTPSALRGRSKRAISESSDEFTLAQQHKGLKVRRTSSTGQVATQPVEQRGRGPRKSRAVKLAKDWGVTEDWLRTTFGSEILEQGNFSSALSKWIKSHPTLPAQDALAHFQRRRNNRLSGKAKRKGYSPKYAWTAADIRMDIEEEDADDDDEYGDDDEATFASTTVPTAVASVSAALRISRSARSNTSSRMIPLAASVATQAQSPASDPDDLRLQSENTTRRKALDSKLENVAQTWKVDMNWLTMRFNDDVLQTKHFINTLHRFVKEHPTISAQTAFEHFQRRRDLRRSGSLGSYNNMNPANLWQAVDLRLDPDDAASSASTTASKAANSVSAAPRFSTSARPSASSQGTPLMAQVLLSSPHEDSSRKAKDRRLIESKLANITERWNVDMGWLNSRFGEEILQTQHFVTELQRWINGNPTVPAQTAFEHFQRRRDLRRSGELTGTGLRKSYLWQAASDLCLDGADKNASSSITGPTASSDVSAPLRSSAAARPSASSPAPLSMAPHETASMLSKLATAWPSGMSSVSSVQNSIATSPPAQPGQMTSTPSALSQRPMALSMPLTTLQDPIAQPAPLVEVPMTEAEAAGILYSPMTAGGLDEFLQVQRAVNVIFQKTPPLHIIQLAVARLRYSKNPNLCIDDDPGYKAWMNAND